MGTLAEHLRQPCDHADCERTATHDGFDRFTADRGKFCNQHCDWNRPAFARNS